MCSTSPTMLRARWRACDICDTLCARYNMLHGMVRAVARRWRARTVDGAGMLRCTLYVVCCMLRALERSQLLPCNYCVTAYTGERNANIASVCVASPLVASRLLHVAYVRVASLHRRCLSAAELPCDALSAAHALLDWTKGGRCGGRAAVRCACAQGNGGVLSMAKGTALFDAVAISDTGASVRARRGGDASRGRCLRGECGRTVCAADLRRAWLRRLCAGRWRGAHGGWGRHV